MREEYKLKMAIIAGAARALDYKDRHPRATTQEIIQHLTDRAEEMIKKIEEDEDSL